MSCAKTNTCRRTFSATEKKMFPLGEEILGPVDKDVVVVVVVVVVAATA